MDDGRIEVKSPMRPSPAAMDSVTQAPHAINAGPLQTLRAMQMAEAQRWDRLHGHTVSIRGVWTRRLRETRSVERCTSVSVRPTVVLVRKRLWRFEVLMHSRETAQGLKIS